MKIDVTQKYLGFFVTEFEPQEPSQHIVAVHRMVRDASQRMKRLVQFPAVRDRRRRSRAHQYARAWTKVNAHFVPRNAMEANLLKVGLQIEQRYHQIAACADALKRGMRR